MCFSAKIWCLVLPLFINFEICEVKMVTRIFEEWWHFTTRENGAITGENTDDTFPREMGSNNQIVGESKGNAAYCYSTGRSVAVRMSADWWGQVIRGGWTKLRSLSGISRQAGRQRVPAAQPRPQQRCSQPAHFLMPAGTSWTRRLMAPTTSSGFSKARTIPDCGGN